VTLQQQTCIAALPAPSPRKILAAACGIHAVHDGYTDTLYLLLPLWQAEFALSYGAVGVMRALYSAILAGFQVPAAALAMRVNPVLLLAGGTALSGLAYLLAGASTGLAFLAFSLMLGGLGSSTQHPIGSDMVASAFPGVSARSALGTYNFAGDIGKMAFPTGAGLLLTFLPWRQTALAVGAIGMAAAVAVLMVLPSGRRQRGVHPEAREPHDDAPAAGWERGFQTLLAIGMADSATRMGFMTFLPFVLAAKGASLTASGFALTLTFAGGAFGKLACGLVGARLGVTRTIVVTKAATAALIVAVPMLPPLAILVVLPLIGMMLNGTSSVIYGSVPDFCPPGGRTRAFGVFYTATIGAGALAPIAFGALSDVLGLSVIMAGIACTALLTLLLAIQLRVMAKHQ